MTLPTDLAALLQEALPFVDTCPDLVRPGGDELAERITRALASRDGGGWLPSLEWLSTQLCEARNHWCEHHEDAWLDTDENHPDDWIAKFIRDAMIAASPSNTTDTWLPIESAPRDGTPILGWFENPFWPSAPGVLYWIDHNGGGWTHYANGKPTHWQPLPPPPAKAAPLPGAVGVVE